MSNKSLQAFEIAVGEIGVREIVGGLHSERVLEYHKATKLKAKDDETSWCASFMIYCFKKAGVKIPKKVNASARSLLHFGKPTTDPKVGDIAVFWRGSYDSWMGHGGFFAGREGKYIIVLGGNQGNKVCYKHIPESKLLGFRRV